MDLDSFLKIAAILFLLAMVGIIVRILLEQRQLEKQEEAREAYKQMLYDERNDHRR